MPERFYAHTDGYSWSVRDREILIPIGAMRGQPHIEQWCSSQGEAERVARELNATRGHAKDEPKCIECGAQPAGPAGSAAPRCAGCHSRMADMHG